MPDTVPPKQAARNRVPGGLLCLSCNGGSFSLKRSFQTATEPLTGSASSVVIVDLLSCNDCGAELPTVRGKRRYSLVSEEKLSALAEELQEAKLINAEMNRQLDTLEKRSQGLAAEIEMCRAKGVVSVLEERVAALEAETDGLAARRAKLSKALKVMAPRAP